MTERPEHSVVPPPFGVEVRAAGDRVLVCPSGEVDVATAGAVESRIREQLGRGARHVVVDLTGVTFMDSTGIRLLLVGEANAAGAGARFSVIAGSPASRRPLEICGLLEHLDIVEA